MSEFVVLGVLAASVLLVGVWPAPQIDMMNASIDQLVERIAQPKLLQAGL